MTTWNLKPALAVVASIGLLAVAGGNTAQAQPPPFSWVRGNVVPPNAAVGGGTVAGAPLHICRGKMANGELHPGTEWKGNCYVGYGGKELKAPLSDAGVDQLVLGAPPVWVAVQAGKIPGNALAAGPSAGSPMFVCRAKAKDGELRTGKAWKGNCYYPVGGAEIKVAVFEVMTLGKAAK